VPRKDSGHREVLCQIAKVISARMRGQRLEPERSDLLHFQKLSLKGHKDSTEKPLY